MLVGAHECWGVGVRWFRRPRSHVTKPISKSPFRRRERLRVMDTLLDVGTRTNQPPPVQVSDRPT